jgi:hypothetical protein
MGIRWAPAIGVGRRGVGDAIRQRQPWAVVHHSDHGSQYAYSAFGNRCREAGAQLSMGSVGDGHDNAMCEFFFATLECELIDRTRLRIRDEAQQAVLEFIEVRYNPHRRHSSLNYECPNGYEARHRGVAPDTSPDLSTETGQLDEREQRSLDWMKAALSCRRRRDMFGTPPACAPELRRGSFVQADCDAGVRKDC